MAKPNYNFEKRKREMAKKKKQEEKRLRKLERSGGDAPAAPEETPSPATTGEK
jgi:hypothetical protein